MAGAKPEWPHLDEQPNVVWPEITSAALHKKPPATSASFLPSMEAKPSTEPYRDPRKIPPIHVAQGSDQLLGRPERTEAEAPVVRTTGRILPVINEAPIIVTHYDAEPTRQGKRAKRVQPILPAKPVADVPATSHAPAIEMNIIAASVVLRRSKDRLTRDEFKRGQRWKARLPASVHRAKSRQRTS